MSLPLADVQSRLRDALIDGDLDAASPSLVNGRDALGRLAIHRRHYETSLVDALLARFPATGWLIGSRAVIEAARAFVRQHPPSAPCIAEYGVEFPAFLAAQPSSPALPYLRSFAELDWHLGRVSVEVERPSLSRARVAGLAPEELAASIAVIQPGTHFLSASWPIDELARIFLADAAPDLLSLSPEAVWLEVRGARGDVGLARLTEPEFVFRRGLQQGHPMVVAAELALARDPAFDSGQALAALFDSGLVTAVVPPMEESRA
jgi:hypothetical protein